MKHLYLSGPIPTFQEDTQRILRKSKTSQQSQQIQWIENQSNLAAGSPGFLKLALPT